MRVVSLPTMNVGDPNVRRTCADFVQYFDPQNTDGLSGVVLDLAGQRRRGVDRLLMPDRFLYQGRSDGVPGDEQASKARS